MKRTCKNSLNRNRPFLNRIRGNNLITPDILVNQIWMQEEETSGVKIIELNSSSDSSKDSNKKSIHPWSYVSNGKYEEHNSIDTEAKRRHTNTDNSENTATYANRYFFDRNIQSTNAFYDDNDAEFDSMSINHQMNCFTILKNQSVESDSSTDNENYDRTNNAWNAVNRVEVVELDKPDHMQHWDHVYNDEIVTYEPNKQSEKHTIWIYSYKNKRLLSDNDYELVNIPSKDASSGSISCSISDEEIKDKGTTTVRLGSPIPTTYIPRLDLSLVQTLSTVTEVSEPNKAHSKESSREVINIVPKNNWLSQEHGKVKKRENCNVINWMSLSPRERRRRSINTNLETTTLQNLKEAEITYAEGNRQFEVDHHSSKVDSSTVQVQVDIHTNKAESTEEVLTSPKTKPLEADSKKIADIIPMKISFADADNDINNYNIELNYANKPRIQINTKLDKADITEPIEKLDCNNWITEEKAERETTVYDYDLENGEETNITVSSSDNVVDSANRRLWRRNLKLMKAPEWSEYLPITCSLPSLHLSLSSLGSKKSWFRRLTRFIKCCK